MKVVALSGTTAGSKTITTMREVEREVGRNYGTDVEFTMVDLREYDLVFSDGRDYHEYEGDTLTVATKLMEADAIIVGMPVFQASMPGSLKNVFDLLPEEAFKGKAVGIVANAGSPRYFLAAENQLKPVLSFMKAEVVSEIAFIEGREIYRTEIIEDETKHRIDRVADKTVDLAKYLLERKDA